MPVKTITAEIDGQVRRIQADVPDGATEDDIMTAVTEWHSNQGSAPAPRKSMLQSGAEAAYEAKYGMPPPANMGSGGLGDIVRAEIAAPAAIMAPGSTAVGMGTGEVARRGAKALGAGDTAADVVGTVSGMAGGALANKIPQAARATAGAIGRMASRLPSGGVAADVLGVVSPRAANAVRVADRARRALRHLAPGETEVAGASAGKGTGTKFGGRFEEDYGKPGVNIPRRGLPEIPPTKFEGKGTRTPYGGPAPAEHGPAGTIIPRRGLPEMPPAPAGRGTGVRFGGRFEEDLGQVGTNIPRRGWTPPKPPKPKHTPSPAATPAKGTGTPYKGAPAVKKPVLSKQLQASIEKAHADKVSKVVNTLKSHGITRDLAERATDAQKMDLIKQAGVKRFTDMSAAWDEILGAL